MTLTLGPSSFLTWRASAVLGCLLTGVILAPSLTTLAEFSASQSTAAQVGAGVWLGPSDPALPTECADMTFDRILFGTNGNDVLVGTERNDLVFGRNGRDQIFGHGGHDCLVGSNGKELLLVGGDGSDVLVGGNGKDVLYGGTGDDRLYSGEGQAEMYGGDGDDQLFGSHPRNDVDENGPNGPDSPRGALTTVQSQLEPPTITVEQPAEQITSTLVSPVPTAAEPVPTSESDADAVAGIQTVPAVPPDAPPSDETGIDGGEETGLQDGDATPQPPTNLREQP